MSSASSALDIPPDQLAIVQAILRRHIPDRKVLAFGSRATGAAREYSDLDLAILGEAPLPPGTRADLAEAFDESSLIFKVDIVVWAATTPAFRQIISQTATPLQDPAPPRSTATLATRVGCGTS